MTCFKLKFIFNRLKKIKIQLTVGLTKPVPKLNLTLAPLNINANMLITEFNQTNLWYFENNYIVNCFFFFNNLQPYLIIKNLSKSYLFKAFLLKKSANSNIINNITKYKFQFIIYFFFFFILNIINIFPEKLYQILLTNCYLFYNYNNYVTTPIVHIFEDVIYICENKALVVIKNIKHSLVSTKLY